MENPAAEQAAPTGVEALAEMDMFDTLHAWMVEQFKRIETPYKLLPAMEQQIIIDRVGSQLRQVVRDAVRTVASKARPTVDATIESVTFKDGCKATLTFAKTAVDRHAVADAAGGTVLLVLPLYGASMESNEPPKPEADQKKLPLDPDAAAEPAAEDADATTTA